MQFSTHRSTYWSFVRAAHAAVLAAAVLPMSVTAADDWPALRSGMWEFNRTIETPGAPSKPQALQKKKCTSPVEDMKKQNEMLTRAGCKFSPTVKAGNTYTFSAECKMQGASGTSKSVLTIESDSAYVVRVESQSGPKPTHEVLQARRTGDCPK
jgi:hypothetical protein